MANGLLIFNLYFNLFLLGLLGINWKICMWLSYKSCHVDNNIHIFKNDFFNPPHLKKKNFPTFAPLLLAKKLTSYLRVLYSHQAVNCNQGNRWFVLVHILKKQLEILPTPVPYFICLMPFDSHFHKGIDCQHWFMYLIIDSLEQVSDTFWLNLKQGKEHQTT